MKENQRKLKLPPPLPSDQEMRIGFERNDEKMFSLLFENLYAPLAYYADTIVNDAAVAKDAAIEALTGFWEHRVRFSTMSEARAYLYIAVRNKCYNHLKSSKRSLVRNQTFYDAWVDDFGTIEDDIIKVEVINDIYKEIARLPGKYKQAIELLLQGKSIPEIAIITGQTENLCSQHRTRAVKIIKKNVKFAFIILIH